MSACTIARAKRERTDEEFAETASGRHASAFRIECHGQDRTAAVRSRLLGCFALCRAGAGADPHLGFGGRRRRQPVQPHRAVQDLSRRDLEDRGGRRNHCLDPGGFGGVTITKAMTIACEGVTAGVLVSGTNGVLASANGAVMTVANSVMSSNNVGANASVSGATIALTNSDLFANNTAVSAAVGSNFISGANNKLFGNTSPGAGVSGTMINE